MNICFRYRKKDDNIAVARCGFATRSVELTSVSQNLQRCSSLERQTQNVVLRQRYPAATWDRDQQKVANASE